MRKIRESSQNRLKRIDLFTEIYIQEYIRYYRPEIIINQISKQYLVAEQTVRDLIKPAKLKKKIEAGKYQFNPDYKSIIKQPKDNEDL